MSSVYLSRMFLSLWIIITHGKLGLVSQDVGNLAKNLLPPRFGPITTYGGHFWFVYNEALWNRTVHSATPLGSYSRTAHGPRETVPLLPILKFGPYL